jgi:hypothetical protein
MADALLPLQAAINAALTEGSPPAVTCSVYTGEAPPNAAFPYIVIGEDTAVDWGTKVEQGQEITATLHAWSRQQGSVTNDRSMKEVKQLLAAIYDALHEQEFSVSGQSLVSCRFDFGTSFRDEGSGAWHGIGRYRLFLSAA